MQACCFHHPTALRQVGLGWQAAISALGQWLQSNLAHNLQENFSFHQLQVQRTQSELPESIYSLLLWETTVHAALCDNTNTPHLQQEMDAWIWVFCNCIWSKHQHSPWAATGQHQLQLFTHSSALSPFPQAEITPSTQKIPNSCTSSMRTWRRKNAALDMVSSITHTTLPIPPFSKLCISFCKVCWDQEKLPSAFQSSGRAFPRQSRRVSKCSKTGKRLHRPPENTQDGFSPPTDAQRTCFWQSLLVKVPGDLVLCKAAFQLSSLPTAMQPKQRAGDLAGRERPAGHRGGTCLNIVKLEKPLLTRALQYNLITYILPSRPACHCITCFASHHLLFFH